MNSSDQPQQIHPERPSGGNWNTRRLETRNKTVSLEGKEECTVTDWQMMSLWKIRYNKEFFHVRNKNGDF